MRILHVDTATEWRGGQNQIVLTAEGQVTLGHHVKIFANKRGELAARASMASLPGHPATVGRGDLSWQTVRAIGEAVRVFLPNVIHVHESHGLLGALLGARRITPRPRVVASRRVDFSLRFLSRLKYGRTDRVLAVSRAVREVLISSGVRAEKVVLVHEGVKDRQPEKGGRDALRALGIPAGAPVVGNVAQLVDHKDHATLLRAAAIVLKAKPECRFLICGDGPLKAELVSLTAALGISDRVIFAGFRSDLDALIPCLDLFCLSSHLEGLGTSVLDAMCFSRPVVATRAGGIPDAVVDGKTGRLAPPRDHEALARALGETLDSSQTLARYGAAGRESFLKDFTREVMVQATLRAYV
ncbi:MAG: glycosyltransferase family 4 protein [Vicinamibacteria bacterium]|nr:glycosyltransferase family 4 protein [Vicinamibacteria bacterium]